MNSHPFFCALNFLLKEIIKNQPKNPLVLWKYIKTVYFLDKPSKLTVPLNCAVCYLSVVISSSSSLSSIFIENQHKCFNKFFFMCLMSLNKFLKKSAAYCIAFPQTNER